MKNLIFPVTFASLLLPGLASGVTITTTNGAGADVQLTEYNNTPQDTGPNNAQLNARTGPAAPTVHEVIGLRFDLTGYDMASINNASVALVNFRANSARILHFYGVADGTLGLDNNGVIRGYDDNTWDETDVRFSTMPGLTYDGSPATQGLTGVADLGAVTMSALAKGSSEIFSSAALTLFLNTHPDSLVTLLIAVDTVSTGQSRFASKEATALDAGSPTGLFGFAAPALSFEIPEPSAMALLFGGGGLLLVRRRFRS